MPSFQDFEFRSSTAVNTIHARKCVPDGAPRRGADSARHSRVSTSKDTTISCASLRKTVSSPSVRPLHLGHGKSVTQEDDLGFFSDELGWGKVVMDVEHLHDIMAEEYPGIPYIMFGHSMGSFLTRTFIISHPDKYDAVILSGTGHQKAKAIVVGGYLLAEAIVKTKGPRADGQKLNDIAFGTYLNKIEAPRTEFDWLSRDAESVDKYIADPMCGFVAKAKSLQRHDGRHMVRHEQEQHRRDGQGKARLLHVRRLRSRGRVRQRAWRGHTRPLRRWAARCEDAPLPRWAA